MGHGWVRVWDWENALPVEIGRGSFEGLRSGMGSLSEPFLRPVCDQEYPLAEVCLAGWQMGFRGNIKIILV